MKELIDFFYKFFRIFRYYFFRYIHFSSASLTVPIREALVSRPCASNAFIISSAYSGATLISRPPESAGHREDQYLSPLHHLYLPYDRNIPYSYRTCRHKSHLCKLHGSVNICYIIHINVKAHLTCRCHLRTMPQ